MTQELPKDVQEKLQRLQAMSQQIQQAASQREQMELYFQEMTRASKALAETAADATAYRLVGGIMVPIEAGKEKARLDDELETMEIRVKRAKSQEEQLRQTFTALQTEVQKSLKGA